MVHQTIKISKNNAIPASSINSHIVVLDVSHTPQFTRIRDCSLDHSLHDSAAAACHKKSGCSSACTGQAGRRIKRNFATDNICLAARVEQRQSARGLAGFSDILQGIDKKAGLERTMHSGA